MTFKELFNKKTDEVIARYRHSNEDFQKRFEDDIIAYNHIKTRSRTHEEAYRDAMQITKVYVSHMEMPRDNECWDTLKSMIDAGFIKTTNRKYEGYRYWLTRKGLNLGVMH